MAEITGIIKIAPVTYTVERADLEPELIGRMSYKHGKIQLAKGMKGSVAEATLLHEVIHTFLRHDSVDLTDAQEENICDTISMGLLRLLDDNPHFFDVLAAVRDGK